MKNILSIVFILISIGWINAQQLGLNSFYTINPYLINPAAAGFEDCITADLYHRNQWVGIDESPRVNAVVFDNRIGREHGFGLDVRNIRVGLLSNFTGKMTYAYHLEVARKMYLSAGASLGVIQQKFRSDQAIASDYTDPFLTQISQSDMGYTSDLGVYFRYRGLQTGISIPQILGTGLYVKFGPSSSNYKLVNHMNFFASYEVFDNDDWVITPSILYKNAAYLTHQLDVGVTAKWNEMLDFGLVYRTTYGVAGMFHLLLADQYRFGYSYEFGGQNITGVSKGAHEITLGIRVCD